MARFKPCAASLTKLHKLNNAWSKFKVEEQWKICVCRTNRSLKEQHLIVTAKTPAVIISIDFSLFFGSLCIWNLIIAFFKNNTSQKVFLQLAEVQLACHFSHTINSNLIILCNWLFYIFSRGQAQPFVPLFYVSSRCFVSHSGFFFMLLRCMNKTQEKVKRVTGMANRKQLPGQMKLALQNNLFSLTLIIKRPWRNVQLLFVVLFLNFNTNFKLYRYKLMHIYSRVNTIEFWGTFLCKHA